MRSFLVYGAGAVGTALAGYLARQGHPVTVVAREAHARAIRVQGGIRVVSRDETFLAPVVAGTTTPETLDPDAAILVTVQAPDVAAAVEVLSPLTGSRPVVTWQNGIRAEEIAADRCPHLYGGVVRFTSTMLEPGEVRLRRPGELVVGRHPRGPDAVAASLVGDLNDAGFTAAESPLIAADKALKLLVNLVSGPAVLIRRTGIEPVLARVQVALLEEGLRVFAAAGIRAEPASGLGQGADQLLERFRAGGSAPDTSGGVYNSTWQNLHHRRSRLENDAYHGEILRLGLAYGVPAPINARVLELLDEVRERCLGPEPWHAAQLAARFEGLLDFDDGVVNLPPSSPEDELEI